MEKVKRKSVFILNIISSVFAIPFAATIGIGAYISIVLGIGFAFAKNEILAELVTLNLYIGIVAVLFGLIFFILSIISAVFSSQSVTRYKKLGIPSILASAFGIIFIGISFLSMLLFNVALFSSELEFNLQSILFIVMLAFQAIVLCVFFATCIINIVEYAKNIKIARATQTEIPSYTNEPDNFEPIVEETTTITTTDNK